MKRIAVLLAKVVVGAITGVAIIAAAACLRIEVVSAIAGAAIIIAAAFLRIEVAAAQQHPYTLEQQDHCGKIAKAFVIVTNGRDNNWPPQMALRVITASSAWGISEKQGKEIVNLVYSDPAFAGAGGPL